MVSLYIGLNKYKKIETKHTDTKQWSLRSCTSHISLLLQTI